MSGTKTTWIAALVLLLTFAAGFAGGAAAHRTFMLRHRAVPPRVVQAMVNHLDRALDLDDGQRKQVEDILARRRDRIESIWSTVRPRVRTEIEATNAEIERVLTPEQRAKFEKMKMRMGRRGHFPGGGPMHDGRGPDRDR